MFSLELLGLLNSAVRKTTLNAAKKCFASPCKEKVARKKTKNICCFMIFLSWLYVYYKNLSERKLRAIRTANWLRTIACQNFIEILFVMEFVVQFSQSITSLFQGLRSYHNQNPLRTLRLLYIKGRYSFLYIQQCLEIRLEELSCQSLLRVSPCVYWRL